MDPEDVDYTHSFDLSEFRSVLLWRRQRPKLASFELFEVRKKSNSFEQSQTPRLPFIQTGEEILAENTGIQNLIRAFLGWDDAWPS